jgi:hypothetical protein
MNGEFSWLVLVAAFVIVTGFCGIASVRLWRIAGSPGGPAAPGEPASVRNPDGPAGRPSS